VLNSKPNLAHSKGTEEMEAIEDTGEPMKRKSGIPKKRMRGGE
jgi:hypothetical protein